MQSTVNGQGNSSRLLFKILVRILISFTALPDLCYMGPAKCLLDSGCALVHTLAFHPKVLYFKARPIEMVTILMMSSLMSTPSFLFK